MGFFKSITKAIQKVEKAVLGNNLTRWLDPGAYYTYQDASKRVPTLLTSIGLMPKEQKFGDLGGTQEATSPEATLEAEKAKKLKNQAGRRQGAGVGATLLVNDDESRLEKSTLLGG